MNYINKNCQWILEVEGKYHERNAEIDTEQVLLNYCMFRRNQGATSPYTGCKQYPSGF